MMDNSINALAQLDTLPHNLHKIKFQMEQRFKNEK